MKKLAQGLAMVTVLIFLAASAEAVPILTFTGSSLSGSIFYDGAGGALVGSGVSIDTLTASGTANDGSFACTGCALSFSTGSNITGLPGGSWNGGGSFVITGTVVDNLLNVIATGTLLSGSWASPVTGNFSNLQAASITGGGTDAKDLTLAAYFGVPPAAGWTYAANITASGTINSDGEFAGQGVAATVIDTDAIPEPASLTLLGLGLVSATAAARRRLKKR